MENYYWGSIYNPQMRNFSFQNQYFDYYQANYLNWLAFHTQTDHNYTKNHLNSNFSNQNGTNQNISLNSSNQVQKIVQNAKNSVDSASLKKKFEKQLNQLDKSHIIQREYKISEKVNISQKKDQKIKIIKKQLDDEYQPSENEQEANRVKKISDTKNVIRNFSRGMLLQIQQGKSYTNEVIKRCNLNESQFYRYINSLKNKISNIIQLRQIWDSSNKFGRAMRIISFSYLRKRFIPRTFNSKIRMIERNIKYKQKLHRGMKNPLEFTTMKYKNEKSGKNNKHNKNNTNQTKYKCK